MTKPTQSTRRPGRITRRRFLQSAAAATAGAAWLGPSIVRADGSDKLKVGIIGCGNRGFDNLKVLADPQTGHPDAVINGVCDVDQSMIDKTKAATGIESREFRDYRKMFTDEFIETIDALVISTPDHMHAAIAMLAINHDKHVYCEKPLAWSIAEARALGDIALAKFGLALQMGTQRSALPGKQTAVNALRGGQIGLVKEVHAFTDRPAGWWANGSNYGGGSDPVPESLNWDLWLGVAPERAYQNGLYHPGAWRGCRAFGTGAIGDMGCHILDTAFYGLGLTYPSSVLAESTGGTDQKYPDKSTITYTFPANPRTDGDLTLTWYEAGGKPNAAALGIPADFPMQPNALILVGTEGTMYVHMDGAVAKFVGGKHDPSLSVDERLQEYPHIHTWVDACTGFGACTAAFPFGANVTETCLLGSTVASRFPGKKLEWDGPNMQVTNLPEANQYLKREPRSGWEVEGL